MTQREQKTIQQIDQKLDDLAARFDRFIAAMKWGVTVLLVAAGTIAALVTALKK